MGENTKNHYIVDASYVLSYLLPDEQSEKVMKLFKRHNDREIELASTPLLFFEVANSLKSAVLRKRLSSDLAYGLLSKLEDLTIELRDVDIQKALETGLKYNISIYDAVYVLLSKTNNLPLLTLDKNLKKIAAK